MSAKRGNRRKTIYDEEMRTIVQDLQYSVRQLVRNPGLALTALVSLALGIGATTAVFSVIYAGLINPYPFTAADRIVRLTMQSKAGQADWINLNGAQVRQVRQLAIVESLLAMDYHAMILDRKSTRLNSSHTVISYAVFCLKKKTKAHKNNDPSPALNSPLSH